MTLSELGGHVAAGYVPEVEVHGIGPMHYLIYVVVGAALQPVRNDHGRVLALPSRSAAQGALHGCGLTRATFVHTSAYGEMIGLDGSGRHTELREPLLFCGHG